MNVIDHAIHYSLKVMKVKASRAPHALQSFKHSFSKFASSKRESH